MKITDFKCKKIGNYSNGCDEDETIKMSYRKGLNLLVLSDEKQESSL